MRYTFLSTFTCIAICACGALQPVDGSDSDGRAAPAVTAQGLTTTQSVPPGSGSPGINTNFVITSSGAVRWNGGAWIVPLPVARGTMLTGVTLDVVPGVEADGSVLPIDVTITAQDSTGFSILGAAATPTSAAPAQPMTIAMSKVSGSSTSFTAVLTPRGFATAQLSAVLVIKPPPVAVIPAAAASAPVNSSAFLGVGSLRWICGHEGDTVAFPLLLPFDGSVSAIVGWTGNRTGSVSTIALRRGRLTDGHVETVGSASNTTIGIVPVVLDVPVVDPEYQYMAEFTCGIAEDDIRAVVVL